jgi:hypothetical protein
MLFEFWIWINSKGNSIQIWIWNLFLQMGLGPIGPIGPTGPPGLVKPNRLGFWVGQPTQPSPLTPLSLSPRALWRHLDRRRRRLVTPAISGGLWHRCLGQNDRIHFLYQLLQLESARSSSPGRSGWFPPRDLPPPNTSDAVTRRAGACWATSSAWAMRVPAGRSAMVWCSWCVLDEVFPRQPLAGRAGTALPCHPDELLGDGECDFPSQILYLSL